MGGGGSEGFILQENLVRTGPYKVPPAVPLFPAVPTSTRVYAGMKPPLGRDPSVNISPANVKHAGIEVVYAAR